MFSENEKALVLYGEGGCGKTSLLAKAASLTNSEWFADVKPICVIRFLGTTPDSSALTPTLISICQQVKIENSLEIYESFADFIQLHATIRRHSRRPCPIDSTF